MSKALLEFNLDDIDDQLAFKRATKSLDLTSALWDILQLRKKLEFHNEVNIDESAQPPIPSVQFFIKCLLVSSSNLFICSPSTAIFFSFS